MMKKEGVFISKDGSVDFEGSMNFLDCKNFLLAVGEMHEPILEHIEKQYVIFGIACAEEGAKAQALLGDEEGRIDQGELVEAVERVLKKMNDIEEPKKKWKKKKKNT